MAKELVAVVTGAASGIGRATSEAMLATGSRVVMVDRDEAALKALCNKHGDAVIPLVIDLLDPKDCTTLLPKVLEEAGQLDILHANAGTYLGGAVVIRGGRRFGLALISDFASRTNPALRASSMT